jgi:hypothetical protein
MVVSKNCIFKQNWARAKNKMRLLRIQVARRLTVIIAGLMLYGIPAPSQQSTLDSSPKADFEQPANSADSEAGESSKDPSTCSENPSYCFDAGTFVARLMQVTDGTEGNYNVVRLNLRFKNVSNGTLVLAYRAHTSIVVDEFENSSFCCTAKTAPDTSATGIGMNQDKDTGSQFKLDPSQTGDVTFQVWGHRVRSQESPYFHYDVTIEEMDPNNPRRVEKQHAIYFGDFTATWHRPRQKAGLQVSTSVVSRPQPKGNAKH